MNESKKLANEEVQQVQEQISNYLEDSGHSVLTQSTKLTAPWINVKFSDVISSVTNGVGGKQTKDGIGIPVTRIETIANQTIDFDKVGFIADYDISKIDKYLLNQGDILFSHINSPLHLGKTAIFKENKPLYHGINLLRIVTKANVMNPYYFNYHCKLLRSQSEFSMQAQHAVNQSSLNQKKLGEFEIPLPALAEQQQIAAKLDELLAQVDNLKTRLDTIPKILKRFRQSVLAAAVSGKLTEDWRGMNNINHAQILQETIKKSRTELLNQADKESKRLKNKAESHSFQVPNEDKLPDSWVWTSFMDSMERVIDCHNKTAPYVESGIYLIRTPDIRNGVVSLENTRFVNETTYDYWSRRCPPISGDILFTREAPMGEAGIIPTNTKLCMGQRIMLLRPMPEFTNPK